MVVVVYSFFKFVRFVMVLGTSDKEFLNAYLQYTNKKIIPIKDVSKAKSIYLLITGLLAL